MYYINHRERNVSITYTAVSDTTLVRKDNFYLFFHYLIVDDKLDDEDYKIFLID